MRQIKHMGQPGTVHDPAAGPSVVIPVTFTDGSREDWGIPFGELGEITAYIMRINEYLREQEHSLTTRETPMVHVTAHRIDISASGESHRSLALLVLALAGCQLGVQIPSTLLSKALRGLDRIGQAAAADESKRN
jgi:hypothetical protein